MNTVHDTSRKYRQRIEWSADNDSPADNDQREVLADYLTVVMLAHVYNLKCRDGAADVMSLRQSIEVS